MATVAFEGETLAELQASVRRWLGEAPRMAPVEDRTEARFREVVEWTRGDHGRRLLVDVARSVLAGDRLHARSRLVDDG